MIQIVMILKHVKTRNESMMKYTKIEQMVHEMLLTEDKAIPWIASSKSSDQKLTLDTLHLKEANLYSF